MRKVLFGLSAALCCFGFSSMYADCNCNCPTEVAVETEVTTTVEAEKDGEEAPALFRSAKDCGCNKGKKPK